MNRRVVNEIDSRDILAPVSDNTATSLVTTSSPIKTILNTVKDAVIQYADQSAQVLNQTSSGTTVQTAGENTTATTTDNQTKPFYKQPLFWIGVVVVSVFGFVMYKRKK